MNYSESCFDELERLRQENLRLKQEVAILQSKERELSDSRRQLFTLLSNLPGMAYRCRNDRHWSMLFVSEGCLELTGYHPSDLLRNSKVAYSDLIHPEDRHIVKQAVARSLSDGSRFEACYRIVDASQRVKWVWERGVGVFDEQGSLLFLEGIVTDMTEQFKQEEQWRHSQCLESTALMIQGIAHEFNNLLQGMTSAAELLSWPGLSEAKGRKHLQQLHCSLNEFKQLVARLVSVGRRSGFQFETLSLDEVVRETLEMLEPVLPSNIRIDCGVQAAQGRVHADSKQLQQALINILTNAVEAIGPSKLGAIELKTEVRTISQAPTQGEGLPGLRTGTYCLLTVSDNGSGMDEETRRRAFDPFYSKKKNVNATGLGLAIAYSIVKGHQGYMYCRSREGEGTELHIFLPLKEKIGVFSERAERAAEPESQEHPEKGTLYVAGIEDAFPLKAVEALRSQGYRIIESTHHNEALETYIQYAGQVDAVLADPETFGLEPQRFMKALFQIDPHVGLLLLSPRTGSMAEHSSEALKNIRLLPKQQVSPEELVREAKTLLHGHGSLA
jgi:PAS domain S-box-containing protein